MTNTGLKRWGPNIAPILDRCPRCAGSPLYTVFPEGGTHYLCSSCQRCWRVNSTGVEWVNPASCSGCEWRWVCTMREDAQMPPAL